ncbi:DUF1441 family protein [Aeromonas aquatica]|uniref:DUF1441 family protein n=1 Tax=Aeromonas aquatica TaxID=558964 RepID=UPI00051B073B|nr:DUF1441 family protein [Aeromonas aquatica]
MGEVTALVDAYRWNISKMADAFGLHRDTIRRRLIDAGVKPCGKKGNAPIYHLADASPAIFASQSVQVSEVVKPERLGPKDRKEWFQSENERLKFEKEVRRVIPEEEHREGLAETLKVVCSFFDSLPDKMERTRMFTPEQLEQLEAVSDSMRNQLYFELKELAD